MLTVGNVKIIVGLCFSLLVLTSLAVAEEEVCEIIHGDEEFPDNVITFELQTEADKLEIRESLGDVINTVSEFELSTLRSGSIDMELHDAHYFQFIRFKDNNNIADLSVNFVEDDNGVMDTYLIIPDDEFIEWQLEFHAGRYFESGLVGNELADFRGARLNILGDVFTVLDAEIEDDGTFFSMVLVDNPVTDILREDETKTYSINGTDYEVTLVSISDELPITAVFSVNGELTNPIGDTDTDVVVGLNIGIGDIDWDIADFFLGGKMLEFLDPNVNNSDVFDGSLEINNENIDEGSLEVHGSFIDAGTFQLTNIKYILEIKNGLQFAPTYVPQGFGVRSFMANPEGLISDHLDLFFAGLEGVESEPFDLRVRTNNEYEIAFTNIQGRDYAFPFVSNEGGIWKFGDAVNDLVFVEGSSESDYVIGDDDYFIVSNARSPGDQDKSVTNVLQYDGYDNTDFTVGLIEVSTNSAVNVPVDGSGTGSLVIGGHTYELHVSNISADSPLLSVDLNADGDIDYDVVKLTAWGGVVIDMASVVEINETLSVSSTDSASLSSYVRSGTDLEELTSPDDQSITMTSTVLEKNFDSSIDDGVLTWEVREQSSGGIDLDVLSYSGPREGNLPEELGEFQFDQQCEEVDNWNLGLTDFGILVKESDSSDEPGKLFLDIPESQRFARVLLVGKNPNFATCGNGIVESREQCDDGNLMACDGCNEICEREEVSVGLEGEGYELSTGSDQLELREAVGDVVDTVSEYELPGLKSGRIVTTEGDTEYFQYLRFQDGWNLQNMTINYVSNENGDMNTYFIISDDSPFIEWEIQFPEGIVSERNTSNNELNDLEDKTFNILGQDYTIVKAEVNSGAGDFEMILVGNSVTDTLTFFDPNTNNSDLFDGFIKINNENINDGEIDVQGAFTAADKYEITDIKYRLTMNTANGTITHIPPGHGIREFMDRPQNLISDTLDLFFAGLEDIEINPFEINARGDDKYEIVFTNIQDKTYAFPFVSNEGGVWKFGDAVNDLVFVEGSSESDYVVGDDDYFVVSAGLEPEKFVTSVLRYEDYNSAAFIVELIEVSTNTTVKIPINEGGTGSLVIGGHTYELHVSNNSADSPLLSIDLNADGVIENDVVKLTAMGGPIIDMAANVVYNTTTNYSSENGEGLATVVGNGRLLEDNHDSVTDQSITMSMVVLAKKFDTTDNGDEQLNWVIFEGTSEHQVDLDVQSEQYVGPLTGVVPGEAGEFQFGVPSNELPDWKHGMTDWGILIKERDSGTLGDPNELILEIPSRQRFAQLFVTLGAVETHGGAGGSCTICGDGIIDIGETCITCPADAGACSTASTTSTGGGGGGGGGGYFPPSNTIDDEEEEHSGGSSDVDEVEEESEATEISSDDVLPVENTQANVTETESDTLVTGALLGVGDGTLGWIAGAIGLVILFGGVTLYFVRRR